MSGQTRRPVPSLPWDPGRTTNHGNSRAFSHALRPPEATSDFRRVHAVLAGLGLLAILACGQASSLPAPAPRATVPAEELATPRSTLVPVFRLATPTPPTSTKTPLPSVEKSEEPVPTASPSPVITQVPVPSGREIIDPEAGQYISPEPPDRDLYELAQRLGDASIGSVPRVVNPAPVSYEEGRSETFWVNDLVDDTVHTVDATLVLVSEHAYWYVDDDLAVSIDDLKQAAIVFETEIRPLMVESFGDIRSPGVDNDPHLTVLHTALRGAAGYYGSQDEYPRQVHPHSNQREIIYMDGSRLRPGSHEYLGVLTHEFLHAVHWNLDWSEDAWVNEGMAELAKELAGYRAFFVHTFMDSPGVQLNYWPDDSHATPPHYGAANLFLSYVAQQYGGYSMMKELVRQPGDGINGVEAYLSKFGVTFLDVFQDWVVANYLDAPDGPYGYPDRQVRVRDAKLITEYGARQDTVPQFAAQYIDLRIANGDALVSFQGDAEVAQVGTRCHSGRSCWWGNRGDSIDATLTREFDLSGLTGANLEFWTWFTVEEDWDYAYVEVSTDGGSTWSILQGRYTTASNPVGNNFGDGYTGTTDKWVREIIDLSPYVGDKVLVRFEYVTDDAVYLDGFLLDDVAIAELGFLDDAEEDMGWQINGFLRIDNVLPQDYVVQLIEERADGVVSITKLRLDENRKGQITVRGFGSRLERAVVVVSPVARGTHQPARYTLTVSPSNG